MAIRTVVTRGYGNGTFDGTITLVVVRGYALGAAVAAVNTAAQAALKLIAQRVVRSRPRSLQRRR